MKYLAIGNLKEEPPMSSEEFLRTAVEEWETVLKLKGNKKVETVYGFAEHGGAIAIGNFDTEAEARGFMSGLPFYKYLDITVSPLISVEDALARAKHNLEAFKAKK
jgi:muconolactone delta-isomerase